MKNVIFDCDCTIGIENCDCDDALALLYLLCRDDINILGITATYGNSDIDSVMHSLLNFKDDLIKLSEDGNISEKLANKLANISIVKGGEKSGCFNSPAVDFIVDTVSRMPGVVHIIGTGSTTNIGGAIKIEPRVASQIKSVTLMGGITAKLKFEKATMNELNLSCDAKATSLILDNISNLNILTANNCLESFIQADRYEDLLNNSSSKVQQFIFDVTKYYLPYNRNLYGIDGYILWDVIAAAYFCEPVLFQDKCFTMNKSTSDLDAGFLSLVESNCGINCPTIEDASTLITHIADVWENLG